MSKIATYFDTFEVGLRAEQCTRQRLVSRCVRKSELAVADPMHVGDVEIANKMFGQDKLNQAYVFEHI